MNAAHPSQDRVPLRAGPLTMVFERGDLRYITLGDREVLRRIYVAVRDHNWGTVPACISGLQIAMGSDHFAITYLAEHRAESIDFAWQATLSGSSEGQLRFSMEGAARSTFQRNRIGICVHYPPECAGVPVRVTHADGQVSAAHFPVLVEPQRRLNGQLQPCPPFDRVIGVAHALPGGRWAELRLTGDLFELEDQRNWIDGSFKLYSTPLTLPFPVEIAAGTTVAQHLTLALTGPDLARVVPGAPPAPPRLTLAPAPTAGRLPQLGLGVASHGAPANERATAWLRALGLTHLRAELNPGASDGLDMLRRASIEARALGVPLELALLLSDDAEAELSALAAALRDNPPPVGLWLPLHRAGRVTRAGMATLVRRHLGPITPGALLGGGTDGSFAELNRERPSLTGIDLVCYAACPTVHADDDSSLVETPAGLLATLRSAHALAGGRPVAVGPLTLRPRFNLVATGPARQHAAGTLPLEVDRRQVTLLGAGWTLAALAALVEGGAHSATFYETTGWRGVMELEGGPPLPACFPSLPGAIYPLYHVLAAASDIAGGMAIPLHASDPLQASGLLLHRGGRWRAVLANLRPEARVVTLAGPSSTWLLRYLDETTLGVAMAEPERFWLQPGTYARATAGLLELELTPHALVFLDQG